jgi:hypothetical protein
MYVTKPNWIERGPARPPVVIAAPGASALARRKQAGLRRGVGMYPDETCYDSARPSWLPNWLDDFTETACKANELLFGNPTGNTAQPGTFKTVQDASGNPVVVPAAAPAAVQNALATCAGRGGKWDPTLQVCTPGLTETLTGFLPWIVGGVVAVMVLPAVLGGGGGRRR